MHCKKKKANSKSWNNSKNSLCFYFLGSWGLLFTLDASHRDSNCQIDQTETNDRKNNPVFYHWNLFVLSNTTTDLTMQRPCLQSRTVLKFSDANRAVARAEPRTITRRPNSTRQSGKPLAIEWYQHFIFAVLFQHDSRHPDTQANLVKSSDSAHVWFRQFVNFDVPLGSGGCGCNQVCFSKQ